MSIQPETLDPRFSGCRIVEHLSYAEAPDGLWSIGAALRFVGDNPEQDLGQYCYYAQNPQGALIVAPFKDGDALMKVVRDVKAVSPDIEDVDGSLLMGEALRRQAAAMADVIEKDGAAAVDEKLSKVSGAKLSDAELERHLLSLNPALLREWERGEGEKFRVFKDIDMKALGQRVSPLWSSPGAEAARAGMLATAEVGAEALASLAGPEVQTMVRLMNSLADRIIASRAAAEVRAKAEDAEKTGFSAKASAASPELKADIEAAKAAMNGRSAKEKAEQWLIFFKTVESLAKKGELLSPVQENALASLLGLSGDAMASAKSVGEKLEADAGMTSFIEARLAEDLDRTPDSLVQEILMDRRAKNREERAAAEKAGRRPVYAASWLADGSPVCARTIGPWVALKVESIQKRALLQCEADLQEGIHPSDNALRFYMKRDAAGNSMMKLLLGREEDPSLLNRAKSLLDGLEIRLEAQREQRAAPEASAVLSGGTPQTAKRTQSAQSPQAQQPADAQKQNRAGDAAEALLHPVRSAARSFARGRTRGFE